MIRLAKRTDAKALQYVEDTCFPSDRHRILYPSMLYMLRNKHALFLVYEEDILCAYVLVLCYDRNRFARIYSLAVLPEYRRRGIAEKLLIDVEQRCKKGGLKLEIRDDNLAAMDLYKKLGYSVSGRKRGYYEPTVDALEMVKIFDN
ncbi:MAG: hypothetical protein A2Y14_05830 [Verrucomicrobia bacterium GWF2_51_19]|nr:MAG: hypothetical protein A2Y14_05830 [Verrucomicrobia bacterium GWF2_51_19]HCJ12170.1 hypothetical protein [Opitutae bacterium]